MKLKNYIWRIWGAFLQESSEVPPKVRLFQRSSFGCYAVFMSLYLPFTLDLIF